MPHDKDYVRLAKQLEHARAENNRLRRVNKYVLRSEGFLEAYLTELKETLQAERQDPPKTKLIVPSKSSANKPKQIIAAACSDLHLSERVRGVAANGVNEYDSVIAASRLWEHSQAIIHRVRQQEKLYTIDKLWVPMLGDMVNGTVHHEALLTNDLTDQAAVVLASRLLKMFLDEISTLNIPIQVDTVVGNHPRTSPKMPTKGMATTNHDWALYSTLETLYHGKDHLSFNVHQGQIAEVAGLYKWRYLIEHGIGWKNGNEEDAESAIRDLFDDPIFRKQTGLKGTSFDMVVIGDRHKQKFLERTIINGTYVGQNELGQSWRLKPIKASQAMWGISPQSARTWMDSVDLTHIKSHKLDNPMSTYAHWFLKKHRK